MEKKVVIRAKSFYDRYKLNVIEVKLSKNDLRRIL